MYCEHCGTKLSEHARFCPTCGSATSEQPPADGQDSASASDATSCPQADTPRKAIGKPAVIAVSPWCLRLSPPEPLSSRSPSIARQNSQTSKPQPNKRPRRRSNRNSHRPLQGQSRSRHPIPHRSPSPRPRPRPSIPPQRRKLPCKQSSTTIARLQTIPPSSARTT